MIPSPLRLAGLLSLAILGGCSAQAGPRPVVVELFQSQGCSSCPPANANLAKVADRPDVIALNFSVTYWDGPGWNDTFAQPKFTARQWDYAHALHHDNVFTPQIVVDGRRDGVGADPGDFGRLITPPAAVAGPTVSLAAGSVTIGAGATPVGGADVWLARYDPRVLNVPIRGGENGGRTLPHKDIVREFVRIGGWNGAAETLALPAARESGLATAILVQTAKAGPILAAAKG
ncbi:MAG TPA: DUF1223 domain-containing protein [Caulobacteraceae bacterium]|jgi:hypothetical protein